MKKVRLDTLLVERHLAHSRERARALILGGKVRLVDQSSPSKPGTLVSPETELTLVEPDHPYVGRGGIKLKHALQKFSIDVAGRDALDIGASTGGFTDVLLRCGARQVVALDVGHGQLDWELRQNPRVVVLERVNARALERAPLPDDLSRFDIVSIDVSFISLTLILPGLPARLNHRADLVALVKPQFEAGRAEIGRGGIVRDPTVHARVIEQVVSAGNRLGLSRVNTVESPITGAEGNREFFLHFKRAEDIDSDSEPT